MKIGYIRISTAEQNTARQEVIMGNLGVNKIYIDKCSGKSQDRPKLKELMNFVREDDIVVVESISRFARNTRDLLELVDRLNNKNVKFISQKERIDTSTPQGNFILTIFAALAQFERECILQRQAEGIAIAKAEGKFTGRPKKNLEQLDEITQLWRNNTITAKKASELLGISRATFYRRIKNNDKTKQQVEIK